MILLGVKSDVQGRSVLTSDDAGVVTSSDVTGATLIGPIEQGPKLHEPIALDIWIRRSANPDVIEQRTDDVRIVRRFNVEGPNRNAEVTSNCLDARQVISPRALTIINQASSSFGSVLEVDTFDQVSLANEPSRGHGGIHSAGQPNDDALALHGLEATTMPNLRQGGRRLDAS